MTIDSSSARPRAAVTGASSGIGAAFARRLARDHYDLLLVARRRERLEALARHLQEAHAVRVDVIAADLVEPGELQMVEKRIAGEEALELLVNNAGFGAYMPFVALDPDRAEDLIRVQVLAVTRLARAALPGMIARGRGAIINVSSRLAFSASLPSPPLPRRAVYAATKAYINTFTQILHDELKGTGVRVQALCPAIVRTEFHEQMGRDPNQFPPDKVMTPEDVVDASLAGLELGEVLCLPTLDNPDHLARLSQAEQQLLRDSDTGSVAPRYR
jgi:hypothetical protein